MKVALIQETIEAARGGAETSTRQMASHLAALGLEVTVVCAAGARQGALSAPFEEDEVSYRPLPARGVSRTLRSQRFLRAAAGFCRTSQFDIVHAITPCAVADVYQPRGGTLPETVRRSTAMVRRPLLRRLRHLGKLMNMRQRWLCAVERRLLAPGSEVHVAALSEYVRRQVLTDYSVVPQRVHLIFNGVEVAALEEPERAAHRAAVRTQLGIPEHAALVLFVAHNFRLKGLRELIQAGALDREDGPRWLLAVVGRDAPGQYLRLASRLGIADRVRFLGSQTDLRPWYAAADVLAHPTWYDPCSRVVLEALSLGLPVVTTRWNGAAEVLEPGKHGAVIETPADTAALAAAIAEALDPAVRCACRADAPRLRALVSMERHARQLLALYEEILAARGAGSAGWRAATS
ncbi:MAG: glycosyltransferase family 4 protein [Phycisphaerae bacterium]|nr:glycosyltransferase family 4 protein [Phycisphaerae bacterium]HOO17298.1 glycosyltransferase family 4 protein [Phycisphaerae bacterium]